MCQSQADGGKRCAAHTRPAFKKAMSALLAAAPGPERDRTYDEHRARLLDHASTRTGLNELANEIQTIEHNMPTGLLQRRRNVIERETLVASLRTVYRQGRGRQDMYAQGWDHAEQ